MLVVVMSPHREREPVMVTEVRGPGRPAVSGLFACRSHLALSDERRQRCQLLVTRLCLHVCVNLQSLCVCAVVALLTRVPF